MADIESSIRGSEKLTKIFGYWPTFHDAEVHELHFLRGDVRPEYGLYKFPILTLKIHVWALTNEVDDKGYLVLRNHTLTTLRFTDVIRFEMEDFNHQNAMLSLSIEEGQQSKGGLRSFAVAITAAFGMGASFECTGIEVVEAVSCSAEGTLLH